MGTGFSSEIYVVAEDALAWMRHPNLVLNGKSPLERLMTAIGEMQVEDLLNRVEFGVYS